MKEPPEYLGLNEMVEELTAEFSRASLRRSSITQAALKGTVTEITQTYLRERLTPLGLDYKIWRDVAEPGSRGIVPVYAFGAVYAPDLAIEVADRPSIAIYCQLLKAGARTTEKIGATIGEALICSHQYPAVAVLFLYTGRHVDYMHLLDREIMMALWRIHKVRIVFR